MLHLSIPALDTAIAESVFRGISGPVRAIELVGILYSQAALAVALLLDARVAVAFVRLTPLVGKQLSYLRHSSSVVSLLLLERKTL